MSLGLKTGLKDMGRVDVTGLKDMGHMTSVAAGPRLRVTSVAPVPDCERKRDRVRERAAQ